MKIYIASLFSLLVLVSCTGGMNDQSDMMNEPSIVGAWEMEQSVWTDGDTTDVWEPYKSLYLFTDKYYSIEIAYVDRPDLPDSDEERTAELMAEMAGALISNSGSYEIVGDSLIYRIMVSKSPDRMNSNERVAQHIMIEQDRVTLTSSSEGETVTTTLSRLK